MIIEVYKINFCKQRPVRNIAIHITVRMKRVCVTDTMTSAVLKPKWIIHPIRMPVSFVIIKNNYMVKSPKSEFDNSGKIFLVFNPGIGCVQVIHVIVYTF